jgi:hypothetical protein
MNHGITLKKIIVKAAAILLKIAFTGSDFNTSQTAALNNEVANNYPGVQIVFLHFRKKSI